MDRQEGDLAGCDDNPSLLVILQPSGGGTILAAGAGMSRGTIRILFPSNLRRHRRDQGFDSIKGIKRSPIFSLVSSLMCERSRKIN